MRKLSQDTRKMSSSLSEIEVKFPVQTAERTIGDTTYIVDYASFSSECHCITQKYGGNDT